MTKQTRTFAKSARGAANSTVAGAFALFTVESAHFLGVELDHGLAIAWTTFCIVLGNALSRFGNGRIGKALEDWIVARLT